MNKTASVEFVLQESFIKLWWTEFLDLKLDFILVRMVMSLNFEPDQYGIFEADTDKDWV